MKMFFLSYKESLDDEVKEIIKKLDDLYKKLIGDDN